MSVRSERDYRFGDQLAELAPGLLAYLRRRLANAEDAADLLSECFVAAWRSRRRVPDSDEDVRRWMFGIAANVLKNGSRAKRRSSALVDRLRAELREQHPAPELDGVRDAVARLPEDQAELIRLVHWEGFSVVDAAAVLEISESTARGRYQRARANLANDPAIRELVADVERPEWRR